MKRIKSSFFIIIILLLFCCNIAFAGRYICVDKNGKEIECIPKDVNKDKSVQNSKSPHRTKGKPAGQPYEYHEENDITSEKK